MSNPKRSPIPDSVVTRLLIECGRRCCLCFLWKRNLDQKEGQIAHIDHDRTNNSERNLVYLCLEHHNQYDSIQIQGKNITEGEVREARQQLVRELAPLPESRVTITVEVDRDFDSFSDTDQEQLLDVIRASLASGCDIRVLSRQRGSVLLSVDVIASDAIRLSQLIESGDLSSCRITGITVNEIIDEPNTEGSVSDKPQPAVEASRASKTYGFAWKLRNLSAAQLFALVKLMSDRMSREELEMIHEVALQRLDDAQQLVMACDDVIRRGKTPSIPLQR